jgi:hypothetical protein
MPFFKAGKELRERINKAGAGPRPALEAAQG